MHGLKNCPNICLPDDDSEEDKGEGPSESDEDEDKENERPARRCEPAD